MEDARIHEQDLKYEIFNARYKSHKNLTKINVQGFYMMLALYKTPKCSGRWVGKLAMTDPKERTSCLMGHMIYTQAPAMCENKHFFTYFVLPSQ